MCRGLTHNLMRARLCKYEQAAFGDDEQVVDAG